MIPWTSFWTSRRTQSPMQFTMVHYKSIASFFNARFKNYLIISCSAAVASEKRQMSFSLTSQTMFVDSSAIKYPSTSSSAKKTWLIWRISDLTISNFQIVHTYSTVHYSFCHRLMLFWGQLTASRSRTQTATNRNKTRLFWLAEPKTVLRERLALFQSTLKPKKDFIRSTCSS